MPLDGVASSLPTLNMSLSLVPHSAYTHPIIVFPIYKPSSLIQRLNNSLPSSLSLPANSLPHILSDPNDSTRASSLMYELIYIGYCIDHADTKTKHGVIGLWVSKSVSVVGKREGLEDKEKGRVVKSFAPGTSLWSVVKLLVKEGVLGMYWTVDRREREHRILYEAFLGKLGE